MNKNLFSENRNSNKKINNLDPIGNILNTWCKVFKPFLK